MKWGFWRNLYPVCECNIEQVPSLCVNQSFGFPRATRCVQQEEDVFTVHSSWLTHHVLLPQLLHEETTVKSQRPKSFPTSDHLTSSRATSLAVIETGFSVLVATKTCCTVEQLSTALSTVFFSSTTFPPLTPWFNVITVLDWAEKTDTDEFSFNN